MDRLWNRTYEPDENGCMMWAGATARGYGQLKVDGKVVYAHRLAWEVYYGAPVPDGMHVLHECDNPLCVNPDHLFLGTHQDNMKDRQSKGRFSSTLTQEQVDRIRERYAEGGVLQKELAEEYGVSHTTISRILSEVRW